MEASRRSQPQESDDVKLLIRKELHDTRPFLLMFAIQPFKTPTLSAYSVEFPRKRGISCAEKMAEKM